MKTIIPILLIASVPLTSSANDGIPSEEAIANSTPYPFKAVIVVVDSNCRKLVFFNNDGQFIGTLKSKDLGLNYPWMPAMAFAPDGSLYPGAQEKRKTQGDEKVVEATVLRIQGLDAVN